MWVWDVETREALHKFPLPQSVWGLRNVDWVDDETVLVSFRRAAVTLTLDGEAIRSTAVSTLTRSFTDQECATYDIDPCPTLEELREG